MIHGYIDWALLAGFVFGYSLLAGTLRDKPVSAAMVFLFAGWLLGPEVLGWLSFRVDSESLRTIAEFTLAMILFTDAANANLPVLRDSARLPARLLAVGLPLTIVVGALLAHGLFPAFSLAEAAILAVALAPTDAALGQPVVTNPLVPARIREDLSAESGLNDGICVPFLLFLLTLPGSAGTGEAGLARLGGFFLEEIGGGVLVGLAIAYLGCLCRDACAARGWITPDWRPVLAVAMAAGCFTVAQAVGGSGFIACFCGGLAMGGLSRRGKEEDLVAAEGTGDVLSLITWMVFGAAILPRAIAAITPATLLYALLSLTLVRMLPVALATAGLRLDPRTILFLGWFGPRGLASIVFAVMIVDSALPHGQAVAHVIALTVLMSVVLHGLSATGLVKRQAGRWQD
jgi:NhaP-type Na+/H+ or K+/H+ antiporter